MKIKQHYFQGFLRIGGKGKLQRRSEDYRKCDQEFPKNVQGDHFYINEKFPIFCHKEILFLTC